MKQQEEVWRDVKGFEGRYLVSNHGRVYSLLMNKIMRQHLTREGYKFVAIYKEKNNQVSCYVHRLVGFAFCDGYEEGFVVNHIDECKTNNNAENLEWVSFKTNINHGTRGQRQGEKRKGIQFTEEHKRKLSDSIKKKIRINGEEFDSVKEAKEKIGNKIVSYLYQSKQLDDVIWEIEYIEKETAA